MSDRPKQPPSGNGGGGGGRRRRRRMRERRRAEGETPQPAREGRPAPRRARDGRREGSREGGRESGREGAREGGRDRDRRDRRRGEGGRAAREREPRLQYTSVISLPEDQSAACALCGKPVRDAVAALSYGEDKLPAHFDCVVEHLRAQNKLADDERLCYLGAGHFGVVRYAQGEGKAPFTIRDKVQYEFGQERPDWRRVLDAIASRKKAASSTQAEPADQS